MTARHADAGVGNSGRRMLRALAAGVLALAGCQAAAESRLQVVVHESAGRRELPAEAASTSAIVQAVERIIGAADNVLRLAVTPEMLDKVRSADGAVEITFAEVRTFTPAALQGREIRARRLMVPLSGELAGPVTTIFVDDGSGYEAGPLRAPVPTEELARLAQAATPAR
ncbi:MAG TPA: hypothetical protein VEL28_03040 [Candidatus Binatia bacterium]|nr:hypothetical protein [Candidatus Binatia bacterium]